MGTVGSTKQKQNQTVSKKGKVAAAAAVVDLSSDSDLDSASAVTKKTRPNSSSSTRTSFATSYVESQTPKLELMAKSILERTKSAEATLQLQRDELALKREISEKEYETWQLENVTKLKAEQNAMLKILLDSGMSYAEAKNHVDEAFQ
ncbi:hypothetical protein HDU80_009801 [Chytriomyces hyalinus]|nr:hypothetical protein HDU80_009801 [Chytriomyces hyalinus]